MITTGWPWRIDALPRQETLLVSEGRVMIPAIRSGHRGTIAVICELYKTQDPNCVLWKRHMGHGLYPGLPGATEAVDLLPSLFLSFGFCVHSWTLFGGKTLMAKVSTHPSPPTNPLVGRDLLPD